MNVLYDYQIFEMQRFGGISRYFYELWRYFRDSDSSARIAVQYDKSSYLFEDEACKGDIEKFADPFRCFLERKNVWGKHRLGQLKKALFSEKQWKETLRQRNRSTAIEALTHEGYHLFHPTYYDSYFLKHLGGKPFVLTVFDMIHEIYPEYFSLGECVSSQKKQLCDAASRIIAISEHTKKDLVTLFHLNPEKIDVVYLGNSLEVHSESALNNLLTLPEKYLLFTGQRAQYKNFYFFLRALSPLLKEDSGLQLVCTGKGFSSAEHQFFKRLGVQKSIVHIPADDTMLAALYRNALMFVFPSLYEGFGLPVLEAFACGCPAILSQTSALSEIGGDAALYFHPKDMRSIRNAIERVLYDRELRDRLIRQGYERIKSFSWEQTGRQTAKVYEKALT